MSHGFAHDGGSSMVHGVHRRPAQHRPRIVAGLIGFSTCAALAVGIASVATAAPRASANAASTSQLQYNLAGLAYLPWSGIDGQPGPNTSAATRAFQRDACIAVDGVAGPQTNGALAAKVRQVQAVARSTQDGAYGPHTKAAVRAWQRAHGVTGDGAAGPVTMAAMGIHRRACPAPPPPPPPPPPGSGTL
ncbi:MAG: hypothetical protein DLM57_00600, partial [Pseudonocardiales bacterium]